MKKRLLKMQPSALLILCALALYFTSAVTVLASSEEPVGLISDTTGGSSSSQSTGTNHKTIYNGQDYSHVYDYDYYTTKVHPELKGQSDTAVLKYFVENGIPRRERGNKAFSVKWYYNQKRNLRYSYGRNWRKYYLYYQRSGYRKGPVARCPKLKNPLTYYKKDGKKISLKRIYDFEYYTKHNPDAYVYWRRKDDAGAIKHFVKTGMHTGARGNAKYSPISSKYRYYVKKIFPDYMDYEYYRAQQYSGSGWLILINQGKHLVSVFSGSEGNWHMEKQFYCSIGAPSTPTVQGTFSTSEKGLYFVSGAARCWYYTRFYAGYMFHSVLYFDTSSPSRIADGRLGYNISHGCVRLRLADAKWIYDNVPLGAKVISYNRPF